MQLEDLKQIHRKMKTCFQDGVVIYSTLSLRYVSSHGKAELRNKTEPKPIESIIFRDRSETSKRRGDAEAGLY